MIALDIDNAFLNLENDLTEYELGKLINPTILEHLNEPTYA